ncbi:cell envelope-related transcriptional attenuator [Weissella koreensis KACC 15510]|uniref:LCP family glycopolymer transferase n=1 Tax=Weissella koreensis TaxID=165096 RepID=UPI00021758CE|nr:LCP family protein [Weissella koreensis]AEJ24142.1 cell envelope-related transcriptional attenuator [Weissella koreensis KACC 15510]
MKKFLLSILGIIVVLGAGFGGYAFYQLHNTTSKINSLDSDLSKTSDKKTGASQSVSYLLLGTDTGALGRSEKGRTDTMMVMTVNPKSQKTTLVSIERDTKIQLNGHTAKLNAAYAEGNSESAISAVEDLLDIKLDGYLLVNMNGLKQLVNSVGGVNVTAPLTFDYEGYSFANGQSYSMDGAEALAFSRMRHEDPQGDYGRQQRQQLVVEAVINKLKKNPTSVLSSDFLASVSDNVRSNISQSSLQNLALKYNKAANTIKTDQIMGQGIMENGVSYQVIPQSEITRVHDEIETAMNEN